MRTSLCRQRPLIPPPIVHRHVRMLVPYAQREGVDDGKRTRIDSSVVNAAIHEPSDSSLLNDSVRVLVRLLTMEPERDALHAGKAQRKR